VIEKIRRVSGIKPPRVARTINVGVGYSWNGEVRKDLRWKALRDVLKKVEQEALKRAASELKREGYTDSRNTDDALKNRIRIFRLRATVGQVAWTSIKSRINACDILVFDITPTKSVRAGRRRREASRAAAKIVTPNVWLELGYALGRKGKERIFVVHAKPNGHRDLPSDLQGLIVGHVPTDSVQSDIALRMKLVNTLRKYLVERAVGIKPAPSPA
jgi:Predicted nucleotide-binding protein containing TIR-like domain